MMVSVRKFWKGRWGITMNNMFGWVKAIGVNDRFEQTENLPGGFSIKSLRARHIFHNLGIPVLQSKSKTCLNIFDIF